jgi:hypothetical protein
MRFLGKPRVAEAGLPPPIFCACGWVCRGEMVGASDCKRYSFAASERDTDRSNSGQPLERIGTLTGSFVDTLFRSAA